MVSLGRTAHLKFVGNLLKTMIGRTACDRLLGYCMRQLLTVSQAV